MLAKRNGMAQTIKQSDRGNGYGYSPYAVYKLSVGSLSGTVHSAQSREPGRVRVMTRRNWCQRSFRQRSAAFEEQNKEKVGQTHCVKDTSFITFQSFLDSNRQAGSTDRIFQTLSHKDCSFGHNNFEFSLIFDFSNIILGSQDF